MNGAMVSGIIVILILVVVAVFKLACIWYEVLEEPDYED